MLFEYTFKQPCLAWFAVVWVVRDGFLFSGSSDSLWGLPVRRRSADTSSVGDKCNSCPTAFWLVWLLVKLSFHCVFILIIFQICRWKAVISYLSGADRPICYESSLGDVATDCLVVNRAIGWCDSWSSWSLPKLPDFFSLWLIGEAQWAHLVVLALDVLPTGDIHPEWPEDKVRWVPCGLERHLAVWLLGQKGRYNDDWWYRRWMEDRLSRFNMVLI